MRLGKSKLGLLLILVLILMASVSARVYIPQDVNQNYPEFSVIDGNGNLNVYTEAGLVSDSGADITKSSAAAAGPILDYDVDGEMEVAYVDSNNDLIIVNRSNGDVESYSPVSGSKSPKGSYRSMVAGDVDNDKYPDIVFSDGSGYPYYVDYDTSPTEIVDNSRYLDDIGDVDNDGYKELVVRDGSSHIAYRNIEQEGSVDKLAQISTKTKGTSPLADIDGDNRLEITFSKGSSKGYHIDNSETEGNLYPNVKDNDDIKFTTYPYTYLLTDFVSNAGPNNLETLAGESSGEPFVCDLGQTCQSGLPGVEETPSDSNKFYGTASYIPPLVGVPELNVTGNATQGEEISLNYNATDYNGYSDILDHTAVVKFESPKTNTIYDNSDSQVNVEKINGSTGVAGNSKAGGYVPSDGKTKAFNATFSIPEEAETGQWNVSVQVKDEKMTGTKNWTTFQIEKDVIRENVSQSLSVGREDTSRQTSLGKSQVTGLSFASAGLTESFTNRLTSEVLGFSSGKDRRQSLDKNVFTDMALSRSGSNFKSSFSVLSSSIVTGSTVSDIYSTVEKLNSVFGLSDSSSATAIFDGSVTEAFGLDISQGKGIIQRTLELILGVSPSEERSTDVNRLSQTNLDVGSSTPTGLAVARSFSSGLTFAPQIKIQQNILRLFGLDLGLESSQSRDQSLQRSENNTITGSFSISQSLTMGRLILDTFSQSLDASRSDGYFFRDSNQEISASGSFEGLTGRTLRYSFGVASNPIRSGAELTRLLSSDLIAGDSGTSDSTFFRGSNQSLNAISGFSGTGMFFGSVTQPLSIGQSFMGMPELFRSINQGLLIDQDRNSTALFGRTEAQDIGASNQFSRFTSVSRILNTGISTTQTFQVFDGVIVLLDQVIGVNGQQDDVFETSRDQETSIGASAGISTSQMVFRSFTQPLIASIASTDSPFLDSDFIDGLVNEAACRIFGQESRFCETNNDQNDQDTGNGGSDNGGGSGGGGIGGIGTGDNSNNESKDNESSGKQGDEKGSEDSIDGSEQIKKVEASLKPSEKVDNIEKLEKSFENLDRGQKVVVETSDDEGSSGSSDSSAEKGDMVEVEEVSFEVEENEDKTEIDIKTVESPEKLNLGAGKDEIYEATNVSTRIDSVNATLVYEVEKEFLSRNNASKNDIVVSRWKNASKVQNLSTEIVNESSDQLVVEAYSPRGFSVFTVGLEKDTFEDPVEGSGEILVIPEMPVMDALKLLLILSSFYLLRKPLIVYLSTVDIRVKYLVETIRYRLLKYYRRFIWKKKSYVGVEELELTEDVSSLENQKEALKFRKNRLEKEVERKKELREKYRRSLSLLSEKIEKWGEKLNN